jgi:hypothetical protein
MAKYIIDTETGICEPYNENVPETKGEKLYKLFKQFEGTKEYDGIVAQIQRWYYGSLVEDSWCATAVSYFASQLGIPIKAENVNVLKTACDILAKGGIGKYWDRRTTGLPSVIHKGDILFWLWSGDTMTNTSSKHVGVCAAEKVSIQSAVVPCIGGNQDDKICVKNYDTRKLYAVYRP